ncbi:hypothetical protein SAY86_018784 [Trapa natans]|uniref:Uncharacterized protein n=1 Tax=Trapa natans TaxID=22666 RepID=A0AAN7LNV2_TRANT|nr:hypothetical protein SAY86_018784 [Trapa natans]
MAPKDEVAIIKQHGLCGARTRGREVRGPKSRLGGGRAIDDDEVPVQDFQLSGGGISDRRLPICHPSEGWHADLVVPDSDVVEGGVPRPEEPQPEVPPAGGHQGLVP